MKVWVAVRNLALQIDIWHLYYKVYHTVVEVQVMSWYTTSVGFVVKRNQTLDNITKERCDTLPEAFDILYSYLNHRPFCCLTLFGHSPDRKTGISKIGINEVISYKCSRTTGVIINLSGQSLSDLKECGDSYQGFTRVGPNLLAASRHPLPRVDRWRKMKESKPRTSANEPGLRTIFPWCNM